MTGGLIFERDAYYSSGFIHLTAEVHGSPAGGFDRSRLLRIWANNDATAYDRRLGFWLVGGNGEEHATYYTREEWISLMGAMARALRYHDHGE